MIAPFSEMKEIYDTFSPEEKKMYACGKNYSLKEHKYTVYRDIKKVNGIPVAYIDVNQHPVDKKDNACNIGIGCRKEYRGKGYPQELLNKFLKTEGKKYNRIWYGFEKDNKASKGLILKIKGFKYLGGKNGMEWYAYDNEPSMESSLFDSYYDQDNIATEGETWNKIKEGARKLWEKVCDLWERFCNWVKNLLTNNRLATWVRNKFCRTNLSKWNDLNKGVNVDTDKVIDKCKSIAGTDEEVHMNYNGGKPFSSFIGYMGAIEGTVIDISHRANTREGQLENKIDELTDVPNDQIYDTMSGNQRVPLNTIFDMAKKNLEKAKKDAINIKKEGKEALKKGLSGVLTAIATFFKKLIKLIFYPFKFIIECLKRDKSTDSESENKNTTKNQDRDARVEASIKRAKDVLSRHTGKSPQEIDKEIRQSGGGDVDAAIKNGIDALSRHTGKSPQEIDKEIRQSWGGGDFDKFMSDPNSRLKFE